MQPNLQPTYLLDVARGERTIFVVVYKKKRRQRLSFIYSAV